MEEVKLSGLVSFEETRIRLAETKFGVKHLAQKGRDLIYQALVVKICTKELKFRQFCLLTDILVYADSSYKNTRIVPMVGASIEHLGEYRSANPKFLGWTHAFQVNSAVKSFIVLTQTISEKDEWVRCLNRVIGIQTPLRLLQAPVWESDSSTSQCRHCEDLFTFLNRRHHCRQCGRVVCGECSSFNAIVSVVSHNLVRVCIKCNEDNTAPPPTYEAVAVIPEEPVEAPDAPVPLIQHKEVLPERFYSMSEGLNQL